MSIGIGMTSAEGKPDLDRAAALVLPVLEPWIPPALDAALARLHSGAWRFDLLNPPRLLRLELLQALRPDVSFQETWREVWQTWRSSGLVQGAPPGSDALAHARARLPLWPLQMLFTHTALLAGSAPSHPDCPGLRLLAVDGTNLCTPNTAAHRSHWGTTSHQHGEAYYPQALAVWLSHLANSTVLAQHLGPQRPGEERVTPYLLQNNVRPQDLVLGDGRLGTYPSFAVIQAAGACGLFRAPGPLNVAAHVTQRQGPDDADLRLSCSAYTRAHYPQLYLPDQLALRAVTFAVPSREHPYRLERATFLTNLPRSEFSLPRLARLSRLRWNHETVNNDIKTRLGLGELRSLNPSGMNREVLAHLTVANIVRLTLCDALPKSPAAGSFTAVLSAVRQANQQLRWQPHREPEVRALVQELIRQQPLDIRPERSEPRMTRPRKRPYRIFKSSRAEWRVQQKVG